MPQINWSVLWLGDDKACEPDATVEAGTALLTPVAEAHRFGFQFKIKVIGMAALRPATSS
jgi:hypothetical protein